MRRTFLYAKLHGARVTEANIHYEGSVGIDAELLEASGILENEQIQVYNVTNAQRFTTYAIPASPGTRIISPNGACARLCAVGDNLIICSYAELEEDEWHNFKPVILLLDQLNNFRLKI
jgi:aspartate 1-decarboxylase